MIIYNAKELSGKIENNVRKEIEEIQKVVNRKPMLVVIQANNDVASNSYISNKKKACERVGIEFHLMKCDEDITKDDLLDIIGMLNRLDGIDGILLQLPLYPHLKKDEQELTQAISPSKDVDCFTYENLGKMAYGEGNIRPLTAKGVIDILKDNNVEIEGKHAVVLGRSLISGKSVADMLLKENATVTICHSRTKDMNKYTQDADILVCCVGKAKFIKSENIKEGSVIVNVGYATDENGKLCGDIDLDELVSSGKPSIVTTVFNCSGTMTVTNLLHSVVECFRQNAN